MSTTKEGSVTAHRIAPLSPESLDPEARAMASSVELRAILEEAREQARRPGGTISQEELERRRPLTAEEHAAGEALLAKWLAEDAAAGVVEPPTTGRSRASSARGQAATTDSGVLRIRVPTTVRLALAERAEQEGISVSQLVLSYVSRGLGQDLKHRQPAG